MELGGGFRAKSRGRVRAFSGMNEKLDSESYLVIEPPRRALVRSREYLSRINDLPESLSDVLRGRNTEITDWFYKSYPMRKQPLGNMEIALMDYAMPLNLPHWQMDSIEEEEHATKKAQAEAVEELLNNQVIRSADELFMECYYRWGVRDDDKRTFWECMSLYGRMNDGGVAVHLY